MNPEEMTYKLLIRAFLEIREAAAEGKSERAFQLSDLFHNVPFYLNKVRCGEASFEDVVSLLKNKAEQKNMTSWLKHSMREIEKGTA